MRHKVIPGAGLDLWRSKSLRPEVEDELSRMNGWKNGAVQPHYFCIKQRCIYTPVSPVPHVEGAGRNAELDLGTGFPLERAQGRPAGGTDVQKQWAGRYAATGMGRAG